MKTKTKTSELELDVTKLNSQLRKETPTINGLVLDGVSQFLSRDCTPSSNMIKFLSDMGILKNKLMVK